MKITFSDAQQALTHLQKPQQGAKPPLLNVKGWDKAKTIYQLKEAIREPFKNHFERFNDLRNELMQLRQEETPSKKQQEQSEEIVNELNELMKQEEEIEIGNKLTKDKFEDVIDSEIMMDLNFAIDFE